MLKRIVTVFATLFLIVASSFVQSSPTSALEAGDIVMQLQPAEQEIALAPDQVITSTITVSNIGRLPFDFSVSASPYQVTNENYDPDFSTESSYTALHNWITFPESNFHLEPGENTKVSFNITVPHTAPGGGQYAAIIVETRDSMEDGAAVKVISQLAALLYARISGEEHISGTLASRDLPGFLLGRPFAVGVTIRNDGNIDFRASHSVEIRDFFTNREVVSPESVDDEGRHIGQSNPLVLPATSRKHVLTWSGAPQLGVFRVKQTVSFLGQSETFEQIVIVCPLWLAGGAAALVFLMILWIILRLRKRRRARPQVF